MSDEKKLNVFSVFEKTADTYQSATERIKAEKGNKIPRFRMSEDGTYKLRILPLAPVLDEDGNPMEMERTGYEYPFRQIFLDIEIPPAKKGGKSKKFNLPVVRATDKHVGKSVDLIDTYVKIAQQIHGDDDALMKLIKKGGYEHGLKWSSQRAMYIIDCAHRDKGIQLFTPSYSQYRDMDDAKVDLWNELLEEDDQRGCPISGITGAWPVIFKRIDNGGKTEYKISINARKDPEEWNLTEDELTKLLEADRIPQAIFRYTRYHAEATVVFLEQYDKRHGMEVTQTEEWKNAVDTLMGELSPDDTNHFDLATAGSSKDEGSSNGITIDDLWTKFDYIADNDLGKSSDEYQELRRLIKEFIDEHKLDIRIGHGSTNEDLLYDIEEELKNQPSKPNGTKVDKADKEPEDEGSGEEDDDRPARKPSRRAKREEPEEDPSEDDGNEPEPEPESEPEPEPEPEPRPRKRPRRPSDDDEEGGEDDERPARKPSDDEEGDGYDRESRRERRRERRAR